jgi:hypothetical protein
MGEFMGNCVWWGAYTRRDVGELASGNASNWAISVRNTGQLPVDTTPKVGDIVVHPGTSYNHVAYVVWVSPDGTSYEMSDMGWCADCGPTPEEAKLRHVHADDEFIHCAGNPVIPTTDWRFADCPFGWALSKGFAASELDGLAWTLDPAEDPYLLSPVVSVPAADYPRIEISLANNAGDTGAKIYFTTANNPDFDEGKAVGFATTSDGVLRVYVVDMSDNPNWQGTITRLRVDPVEAGNSDGSYDEVAIARIRFVSSSPLPEHRVYLPLALRDEGPDPGNQPPHSPSQPLPSDDSIDQPVSTTLTWQGGDPDSDAVTYDVLLEAEDDTPEALSCANVSTTTCEPGPLLDGTHYYWQVVATDEHSATTEGPVWGFTTIPASCVELIVSGGFETDSAWELPNDRAGYTTERSHSGNRSVKVPLVDPPSGSVSYSSAFQTVTIPAAVSRATLYFWLYTLSGEPSTLSSLPLTSAGEVALSQDAQYVRILNEAGSTIESLFYCSQCDDRVWTYHQADLSKHADRTIKVYFGVFNNGQDPKTAMYVDDVSLVVCSP